MGFLPAERTCAQNEGWREGHPSYLPVTLVWVTGRSHRRHQEVDPSRVLFKAPQAPLQPSFAAAGKIPPSPAVQAGQRCLRCL